MTSHFKYISGFSCLFWRMVSCFSCRVILWNRDCLLKYIILGPVRLTHIFEVLILTVFLSFQLYIFHIKSQLFVYVRNRYFDRTEFLRLFACFDVCRQYGDHIRHGGGIEEGAQGDPKHSQTSSISKKRGKSCQLAVNKSQNASFQLRES